MAGILATTDMNPILIKPTRDSESQIVVNGEPYANLKAMAYRQEFYEEGLRRRRGPSSKPMYKQH